MKQSGTKREKLKWLLPVAIFAFGILIWSSVVYKSHVTNQERVREMASLNAVSYSERMISDLREGISITDALEEIVISENGKVDKFQEIAADMMTDSLQSIQLAPDGIVTEIYPKKGNEAGKINLLQDEKRGEVTRYGRDHDMTILQGPFSIEPGRIGNSHPQSGLYTTGEWNQDFLGIYHYDYPGARNLFRFCRSSE